MFQQGALTLGVFFPIESFEHDKPTMLRQRELAQLAEESGFAALWFRDVPLRDPTFGDIGQVFDPWVYLGYMTALTRNIALATGSIILPLRHPVHTAKAAASVDQLSKGRFIFGIASGDRPVEFPAFGCDHERRGEEFREHIRYFDALLEEEFPHISTKYGGLVGDADLVPKPWGRRIPRLVTASSRQDMRWIVENSDGWITYPRTLTRQREVAAEWRRLVSSITPNEFKPFAQSLYIDLDAQPDAPAIPIHLGYRLGRNALIELLDELKTAGVSHVAFNLKYGRRSARVVLEEIAKYVVPRFPANKAKV
ncbi:MAG: TIGR03571 family LLM class oxidoreductase [Gammaproteobacteria bacterium]|nr:TIGR03571 family LLM class oxidoreductase [Gammaproteobacteria bacterium]